MKKILDELSVIIKQIRQCKMKKTCPKLNQSRQYYFEPNPITINDWKRFELTFLNGIDNRVVFICESPGDFAKGAVPADFPTDGSKLYRAWATYDPNPAVDKSKLQNNKKFKEFRELAGLKNCYITNVCKCGKIPDYRERKVHTENEINNCSIFLEKELQIIKPSLIVAVGRNVYDYLMQFSFAKKFKIFKMTHYSYYKKGSVWRFWKGIGEGGELDRLISILANLDKAMKPMIKGSNILNITIPSKHLSERTLQTKIMNKVTDVIKQRSNLTGSQTENLSLSDIDSMYSRCNFKRNVKAGEGFYKFFKGEKITARQSIKTIKEFLTGSTSKVNFMRGRGTCYASKVILESDGIDVYEAFKRYYPLHPNPVKSPQGKSNPKDRFLRMLSVWTESGAISIKDYIIHFESKLIERLKSVSDPISC